MSLGAVCCCTRNDPTDFTSVVRVILHYIELIVRATAPTEFISVERMILH
jgi:hypothetical protein